ncbi:MAG: polysaccharide deacetylase family protein [Pygmaiobacter sp.]
MTHRVLLVVAVAVCGLWAAAGLRTPKAVAVASHEWGLSFQTEGSGPVPNLSKEELRPFDAYYCADETQKRLYLTFDAGYENGNTAPILDALSKHHAQGAFFVVGPYIKENPELVRRMIAEGHLIGNHTYHHPDMSRKDKASFTTELCEMENAFCKVVGTPLTTKLYRPPEGKFTDENLSWAQELGYKTIFWSLAYVDWNTDRQPSREQALDKLLPRTHNGAIVLLHSTSATNAAILDELLTKWEEMGYSFGSLTELCA